MKDALLGRSLPVPVVYLLNLKLLKNTSIFIGQGLFPAAATARGASDLWGLFWTKEMRQMTLIHTNRRIYNMMEQMGPEHLANNHGIGTVDMVS